MNHFNSPGDLVGHQLGGYEFDGLIAQSAITWLRKRGRPLHEDGHPWALTVSLVNPHDVMYFNNDPAEMQNLAMTQGQNTELVTTMNAKLNALIEVEIGQDNGRELPHLEGVSWELRTDSNGVILD